MSPIQEAKAVENREFKPVPIPSETGTKSETYEFLEILSVLKERCPNSGFIYNAVKLSPRFPAQSKLFYINPFEKSTSPSAISENQTFILYSHFTEDNGQNFVISAPKSCNKYSKEEEETLVKVFSKSDHVIPWEKPHWIIADQFISRILIRIEVEEKGHSVAIHPENLFIYEDSILHENFRHTEASVRNLSSSFEDSVPFIKDNWAYHKDNSDLSIGRFIKQNEKECVGVYPNGSTDNAPVSGFILNGFGLISMLYTLHKGRGKGYAQLGLKVGVQRQQEAGLVPTSSVEVCNARSVQLHEKVGFKRGPLVQWIMYTPIEID